MVIQYTDQQLELVHLIKTWYVEAVKGNNKRYFVYTGVSGSGKTTVLHKVIEELRIPRSLIIGCAFIGKAVSVLSARGIPAQTIHSLLYYLDEEVVKVKGEDGEIKKVKTMAFKPRQQLDGEYKLIIVDEGSMVNDDMVKIILSHNIPVIFIGDTDQLPPVSGISTILQKPDFRLTEIMRQVAGDPIIMFSQLVLQNKPLPIGTFDGPRGVSRVIRAEDARITPAQMLHDYDVVLTAYNRKRDELNNRIRQYRYGDSITPRELCLGDHLICKRNDWKKCVRSKNGVIFLTTGLVGQVSEIYRDLEKPFKYTIDFDDIDGSFSFPKLGIDKKYLAGSHELRQRYKDINNKKVMYNQLFEYAYALTVHSSQGSTYNRVLFYDVTQFIDQDTTRKLRNTAVTRASHELTVIVPY